MPRTTRLDTPGMLQHMMIRGIERRKIFRKNSDWQDMLERLGTLLSKTGTACCALAFLNIAMLIAESDRARLLRQMILDIVIETINQAHLRGWEGRYINQ